MNNLILAKVDTDAMSVCKPDQSPWTKEEELKFVEYINSQFPELIRWESEGTYEKLLVLKTKNYVFYSEGKKKIKGSALTDSKRSKIYLQFMEDIVDYLLTDRADQINDLYKKYIKQAINIQDIHPWCKKVTITDKILNCKGHHKLSKEQLKAKGLRSNETKVYDALKGKHVQEGDKIYVYFQEDRTLALDSDFDGKYSKPDMLKGLHSCLKVFKNVLDIDQFVNYSLKKNYKVLERYQRFCKHLEEK